MEGMASVDDEAVAERAAGRCPGRCERLPSRCISRETSLESYVRPVVDFDGDVWGLLVLAVLDEDAMEDNDEGSRVESARECDRGGNRLVFE